MHKERIAKFVSNQNITIVDAMEKIDNNAKGILFIEDEAGCLVGCITDGDIRRWLIKTGNLQATVKMAMKESPKYLLQADKAKAQEIMQQKDYCLAYLNERKYIVDIVLHADLIERQQRPERKALKGVSVVIMLGKRYTVISIY